MHSNSSSNEKKRKTDKIYSLDRTTPSKKKPKLAYFDELNELAEQERKLFFSYPSNHAFFVAYSDAFDQKKKRKIQVRTLFARNNIVKGEIVCYIEGTKLKQDGSKKNLFWYTEAPSTIDTTPIEPNLLPSYLLTAFDENDCMKIEGTPNFKLNFSHFCSIAHFVGNTKLECNANVAFVELKKIINIFWKKINMPILPLVISRRVKKFSHVLTVITIFKNHQQYMISLRIILKSIGLKNLKQNTIIPIKLIQKPMKNLSRKDFIFIKLMALLKKLFLILFCLKKKPLFLRTAN